MIARRDRAAHRLRDAGHDPRPRAARRHAHRVRPRARDPVRHRGDRRRRTTATSADGRAAGRPTIVRVPIDDGVAPAEDRRPRALRRRQRLLRREHPAGSFDRDGVPLDDLIDLLELEQLEVNLFRGVSPDEDRERVFGGQVAGAGACRGGPHRRPDRPVHSLHAYFLRPGDPNVPIVYDVDRIRDGRSFTTRRVVAIQHGQAIFNLPRRSTSSKPGPEHQRPDARRARRPTTLPTSAPAAGARGPRPRPASGAPHVIDADRTARHVGDPWIPARTGDADARARPGHLVPRRRHAARRPAAARVRRSRTRPTSRCSTPRRCRTRARATTTGFMIASLDHAMWFHRPFRADEWLLYHQHSPSAGMARGLREGCIFRADGTLAVTRGAGRAHPAGASTGE